MMKNKIAIVLISSVLLFACRTTRTNSTNFESSEARNILSFIASDEMKGRAVGSVGIDKTADFIADYFKSVGLKYLEGQNSYFQNFSLYSTEKIEWSITANDSILPKERLMIITQQSNISDAEKANFTINQINATDSFYVKLMEIENKKLNQIVFVNSKYKSQLPRLFFWFNRNAQKRENSVVYILSDTIIPNINFVSIKNKITSTNLKNVVGVLTGKKYPNEFVLFSAHYDHLGVKKTKSATEDSIYNGANDDGSGTTAMMMLAKHFSKLSNDRSIVFAAFTAEEIGGFGSKYFSEQLDPAKVVAMFNIEMIGTESKWGKNSAYITGFEKSSLGEILQRNLKGSQFEFHPDPYPDQQLFYRSDNATLAQLGVPAHTISTSKMDNEPNYHKTSDEVQHIDFANMTKIIEAIALSAKSIIDGKDTPSRVEIQNQN